ncbi:MAG TPA: tetratricopeptide repeat protein [Gemmataceae bacterium]|nr:tetratricopeptide repeat protein [Gemmataceae bacterium]
MSAAFRLLRYPFRHPIAFFARLVVAVLLVVGVGVLGVQAWANYHLSKARMAVARYHNAEAHRHLRACLWAAPERPEALLLAARTARREEAFEIAEDFLARYERTRGPDDEQLLLERVLLQVGKGRLDSVQSYCTRLVDENHPFAPLILEAITAYFIRVFRLQDADVALKKWRELAPQDTQAIFCEAVCYELKEQNAEARKCFGQVLELDPERADARFRLAGLLIDAHEESEALPHLEYLHALEPEKPQVLVELARCCTVLGRYDQADAALGQVLDREPANREALAARGKLYMQWDRVEEAEGYLRRAVELDPGNYPTRYQLYLCLSRLKKNTEAEETLARLEAMEADLRYLQKLVTERMQQNPNDPVLHYEAAMIYLRSGHVEEGVRWLKSCLKVDPNYAPAHKVLATYYQRTGDLGRSRYHSQMYKTAQPQP